MLQLLPRLEPTENAEKIRPRTVPVFLPTQFVYGEWSPSMPSTYQSASEPLPRVMVVPSRQPLHRASPDLSAGP